jgi:hypothetical protein
MPTDSKGKFHPNHQLAHAADRMPMPDRPKPPAIGKAVGDASVSHTTLHDHGDGTFHLEHEDGSSTESPHIGHALMSMASKHSDGMHMHVHQHPTEGLKTHHVGDDGQVQGPHDHANIEALKDHLGKFFNEEEHEGGGYGGGEGYGSSAEDDGMGI